MLEVDDVHTNYGESYVLQGVSLRVAQGEAVAVLGRNLTDETVTANVFSAAQRHAISPVQ